MKNEKFITLGIESSCDETSVAVIADGREVLSNVISTQIEIHKEYGGVVPEIASRHHLTNINSVLEEALAEAEITMDNVDLIAVTCGPGLIGALVIGVATAKALAFARGIPIVGVNHMHGHICASLIENMDLKPPFVSLVVSGGHTNIIHVKGYNDHKVIGATRDDAVGEAYDKVARVLDLGYPGGPKIDSLAKKGNPEAIDFKRVMLEKGSFDFSFSGIKTAVLNYANSMRQKGEEIYKADLAASFQAACVDVLIAKTIEAIDEIGEKKLVLSGGVAANSYLRDRLKKVCEERNIELYIPSPVYCTDNGAMIGVSGYYKYIEHGEDNLELDAISNLPF